MGTYVYSLRKKHVEANLEGIYPIDVVSFEYAYKETYVRQGEYGYASYQRMSGRVYSLAKKAQEHYYNRAREEFNTTMRDFYFAHGGLTDGSHVFKMFQCLPSTGHDAAPFDSAGPCQSVGRLFKVGRGQWIVSTLCPKHRWNEIGYGSITDANDNPIIMKLDSVIHQCERCDHIKERSEEYQP